MDNRPEEVQLRTEFGHWEADTVVSKQGVAACLATFIERKTRHYVAIKIPNKTGRSMMTAIKRLVEIKLRNRGKRYKIKNTSNRLKRPDRAFFEGRTLSNRPEEVQLRTEFGHWEADTVVSKQGVAACLATFIERKTRHYVAIKIPNKTGRSMMTAIKRLVKMYPHGVKSITCDRGSEFVNQFEIGLIEDTFDCKIYYANPCAPHERGSNENHNGLLREYFPKPSNFKNISQNKINQAVQSMNLRPRKIFKWKSPQHKFNLEYSKAF